MLPESPLQPSDCGGVDRRYPGRMTRRLGTSVAGLLLLSAGAAAQVRAPLPNVGPPLLLQLEGVVEATPAAARGKGFGVTSFGFVGSDARRWLAVTKARTVGGDQPLDGKDVLALVAPFTPNFLVAGPEDLVAQLRDAPPGTAVRVEGLVDRGARTYYLRRVEHSNLS
jgi:hypothetical protein